MRIYYWMEHTEEYTEVPETEENVLGLELNSTTSIKGIQSLMHFFVIREDNTNLIQYNASELSHKMVEKFKTTECYKLKSEKERQEIIEYLNNNPDAISYDPNGWIDI